MYFTAKGELAVSRQAFAKARELIDPRAFTEISDAIVDEYEKACQTKKTYKGYRLIAVDGSIIDLPDNPRTRLYFGYSTNGTGKAHAKGLAMAAYDVLNRITIFAELYRYDDSEKKKMLNIAEGFKGLPVYQNALFLLDRGYPSFELFKQFQRDGQKFLVRVSKNSLKEVNRCSKADSVIDVVRNGSKVKLRVLNILLSTGETEKLVTNLFELQADEFQALYGMRWGVETSFNFIKNKLLLETFTGESIIAVLQDFYSSILMLNMASIAYAEQEDVLEESGLTKNRKYRYKPNMSRLICDIKALWVKLLVSDKPYKWISLLINDKTRILAYAYAEVPDRHHPRDFGGQGAHKHTHSSLPL